MILFYTKTSNPIWHEPYVPFSEEEIERLYPKQEVDGRRYTTVPLHAPDETKNGATSRYFKGINPPTGRHWRVDVDQLETWEEEGLIEWSAKGNPRKKIYYEESKGKRVQDVWEFNAPPFPTYPTEKNLDLLKLIVSTSSNEDSIVLDAFCGSGTTLLAARLLGRSWIGIDQSDAAIAATKRKLGLGGTSLFDPEFETVDLLKEHGIQLARR